jgi:hypothetical protein
VSSAAYSCSTQSISRINMVRQATVKINLFMIPPGEIAQLKAKLASTGMTVIKRVEQDD